MRKTLTLVLIGLGMCAVTLIGASAAGPAAPAKTHGEGAGKEMVLDLADKVTLKLVQIPAGKFLMGSPVTEKNRDTNETQHEVTISKPFYMGETHVTVDQFAAFVKATGYKTIAEYTRATGHHEIRNGILTLQGGVGVSWRNPGFDQKGDHPVVEICWDDAQTFCEWLSKKSGKTVRLPTEAQWEYACRAGTKTAYPWGDNPDDGKGWANCSDQSLKKILPNDRDISSYFKWEDGFAYTSPVKSYKPNAFGIYDMVGNALQWCDDRYGDYEKSAAIDPTGAKTGDRRVLRGGAWNAFPGICRSASRDGFMPNGEFDDYGFRVVVTEGAD